MKKLIKVIAVWVVTFFVVSLAGCTLFPSPEKKPETPVPQKQAIQGGEPDILVYMHETGEKKKMKMEDYITGVVAGEMKSEWPVEALAAQAILARTFTIKKMEETGGVPERGAQASTDIKEFQAYNAQAVNDNVRKAVQMTRGMILTYQDKPIYAWFHASAGGITAQAKEGLNYKESEPPYIISVNSPDELAPDDVKNWTAEFDKAKVMMALQKQNMNIDKIDSMDIKAKGPSGRATVFTLNKTMDISAPELRIALGSTELKSLLLDKVEVSGDKVLFTGKGYGHGVGMSQWGAYNFAKQGKKPEEIVGYYFRNVKLEKRWD